MEKGSESVCIPNCVSDDCPTDCLCRLIPINSSDESGHPTALDVDEIYHVLGKDMLRSSLLEDIGLYLECDEESIDSAPSDGHQIRLNSICGAQGLPGSDLNVRWTIQENKYNVDWKTKTDQPQNSRSSYKINPFGNDIDTHDIKSNNGNQEVNPEGEIKTNSMIIKVKPQLGIFQYIPVPGTKCYILAEVVEEMNLGTKHNSSNEKARSFSCENCQYTCNSSRLLQRHTKALHNAEREVHCCDKCGRMYKQKRSLDTHMKVHGGVFEYNCNKCSKSFASRDHLRLHQRIHIETRGYICNHAKCRLAFRTNGHLQQHERNVHGPGSFPCPQAGCSKVFTVKRLCDAHYKVHTAAFRCSHASCSRTFRDRYNLQVHLKTHRTLQDNKVALQHGKDIA